MNLFVGIGKITEITQKEKVIWFTLRIPQIRPCVVPCIIFNPNNEERQFIEQLGASEKTVWLQGRIISDEDEYQGRIRRTIKIVPFPKSVKPI
jgi:hypothetical protein